MLNAHKKEMDLCSACPRLCQSACPVSMVGGNQAHSPWGIMQTLNMVRRGEIPFDAEVASLGYQCLTCMACREQCEHGVEIPPILMEVRKKAVERDLEPSEIRGFAQKFHKHSNPFSKDLLIKLKEILSSTILDHESSTIYYPSCTTLAKTPEVVGDTFDLFNKLKIDFVGVYQEPIQCCGYPLLTAGMEDEFVDLAEINFHTLKKYKTVISGSPTCVYTMREIYKKYDFDLGDRIISINQFLEPYLHNINYRVKDNLRTKLMYHDPCYSARYLGETDMPREMISQVTGTPPIDFYENRKKTMCSGQGGCFSVVSKDTSDAITKRHLEEVREKNINLVVTQCPSCVHKFRKNAQGLAIKDLVTYLNDCIEDSE